MPILGFLVNPVAGMGGAVGLKGTDGVATLREARRRGAKPVSPDRARDFLTRLKSLRGALDLLTAPGTMGADYARAVGLEPTVVGRVGRETSATDTMRIVRAMRRRKVELLVFCGGDGTARDVFRALTGKVPVLGVPAGVKVYSSVFAINPGAAAGSAVQFLSGSLPTTVGDVLDIDERLYRQNRLSVKLVGHLTIPDSGAQLQASKSPTLASEGEVLESVAKYVTEEMETALVYVLGSGTTVERIASRMGFKKSLLGVDVVKGDGTVLGLDVDETRLLQLIEPGKTKVIVSPIGGQGFLFGRGNQQISARVLRKVGLENLIVVASRSKIEALSPRRLLVDTGDPVLDNELRDWRRVITGYREEMSVKVE